MGDQENIMQNDFKQLSEHTLQLCNDITMMVYSGIYGSEEFVAAGEKIRKNIRLFVEAGQYGFAHQVIEHTYGMLEKSRHKELIGRDDHSNLWIRYEDLEVHIKHFGCMPIATMNYIWGDANLDMMIVDSAFRVHLEDTTASNYVWSALIKKLAEEGSPIAWKTVVDEVIQRTAQGAFMARQALKSIGKFKEKPLLEHAELFLSFIDMYEANFTSEHDYSNRADVSTIEMVRHEDLYRNLHALGKTPIAHRFMDNERSDYLGKFKIQELMHQYGWTPSPHYYEHSRNIDLGKPAGISLTLYLLEHANKMPVMRCSNLSDLANVLALDGTVHEFGEIHFSKKNVGALIDMVVNLTRNSYEDLKKHGVSDHHIELSDAVNELRLQVDLGI
jgi:hypothetical protein